jgi:hypothetical protein
MIPRKRHQLYWLWIAMRRRARRSGFAVAPRWLDFWLFVADMSPRPPGAELVMARKSEGYVPGNCFWAHRATPVTVEGVTLSTGRWARLLGVPARLIWDRVNLGMPAEEAVKRPVRPNRRTTDQSIFRIRTRGPGGEAMLSRPWGTFAEALEAWRPRRAKAASEGYSWEVIRETPAGDVVLVMS